MDPVTIKIRDNQKTIAIPWRADMNVQEALQAAYDQEKLAGRKFDFAVQYFGFFGNEYAGYFVVMIDHIYDDPKDVNDYWLFYVNGNLSSVGIDNYMVNAGDTIEFDYLPLTATNSENLQHKIKSEFYLNN